MSRISLHVTRRDPGGCVLVVGGAVDLLCSRQLSAAVNTLLDTVPKLLVIDLRAVELVDSSGLAVLVQARRRALRHGVELKLVCDVPRTLRVLAITGLHRSFEIFPSSEAALQAPAAPT
jgi:anti-sigma B factor antagonist